MNRRPGKPRLHLMRGEAEDAPAEEHCGIVLLAVGISSKPSLMSTSKGTTLYLDGKPLIWFAQDEVESPSACWVEAPLPCEWDIMLTQPICNQFLTLTLSPHDQGV